MVQPAPEEFDSNVDGQQFVVAASSSSSTSTSSATTNARVQIIRSTTGGLFTSGLEMISKGSRFMTKEGDYFASAVDVASGYLKSSDGPKNLAVIRICCGGGDWLPSLQVVKLGCCDVGYHGVPFLAKAIRTRSRP